MSSGNYTVGDEAARSRLPPSKKALSFKTFLWNPEEKTVLGRTAASWGKIGAFYIVFYAFLAAFFSITMAVFYSTLNFDAPKYTGDESVLTYPGLGFRPRPITDENHPTIHYKRSDKSSIEFYSKSIEKFLEPYWTTPEGSEECLPGAEFRKAGGPVCSFDVNALLTNVTCNPDNHWGYNSTSPCIIFKLNRMFHWKPEPLKSLDGFPKGLQEYITEETLKQYVWVWCESEGVELKHVSPGLPLSYFPFLNQKGYLSPLALVQVVNLTVDQSVDVRCRVWASNVPLKVNIRYIGQANINIKVQ